jgi:hypothetical protein
LELEATAAGFSGAAAVLLAQRAAPYRFLLDGFDELRLPAQRAAVLSWLLELELDHWPEAQFVLTTRRAAWREADRRAIQARLLPWTLLRLTRDAVKRYVRLWFPLVADKESLRSDEATRAQLLLDYKARGEALISEVIEGGEGESARVERLTGNPLLLIAGRRSVDIRGIPSGWYFRGFQPIKPREQRNHRGLPDLPGGAPDAPQPGGAVPQVL